MRHQGKSLINGKIFEPKPDKAYLMDKEVKQYCPLVKFLTQDEYKEASPHKNAVGMKKKYVFKYEFLTEVEELWIAKAMIRKYPTLDLVDKQMKSFDFDDDLDDNNAPQLKSIWNRYIFSFNESSHFPPSTKAELLKEIRKMREEGHKPISKEELVAIKARNKLKIKENNRQAARDSIAKKQEAEVV